MRRSSAGVKKRKQKEKACISYMCKIFPLTSVRYHETKMNMADRTPDAPPAQPPNISDAEWVVMTVVWERKIATANQVVEALAAKMNWKPKTIHTLLRRLVQKKALAYDKKGR